MVVAAMKLQRSEPLPPQSVLASLEKRTMVLCLFLFVLTLAVYNPIAHSGFVSSDDNPYILQNPAVSDGLSWSTVKWAFTTVHAGYWHPLTWLSHALDCQLFGLNPVGHHYVSLLFHAANGILLFLLLLEATGATLPSLMVAALFALHPQNVESVAWAAERKNVLSMFFFLLAMIAYDRYARRGGRRLYAAVAVLFALGLMAKPQIITLPCVMLLWDYWPLGRMFNKTAGEDPGPIVPRSFFYLLREKFPLFVLAVIGSAITVWGQRAGGAVRTLAEYSLGSRLENAVVSYTKYLANTIWPVRLAPMYPHPVNLLPVGLVVASAFVLVLVTTLVFLWPDRRYLATGWLWFLGTLIPMIGIVQVGEQAMADRFAYIPMIGLFVAAVWAITEAGRTRKVSTAGLVTVAGVILATLGTVTYRQLGYWRNGETLWRYTLSVTENNYMAHDTLAMVLGEQRRSDEAIVEFRVAERLHQYPLDQILTLGVYEESTGHPQGAIEQYTRVLQGSTDSKLQSAALTHLGEVHCRLRNYEEAKRNYDKALQLDPGNVGALFGEGLLAERAGDSALAAEQFSRAVKLQPTDNGFLFLADALRQAGHLGEAKSAEQIAEKISSNFNQARKTVQQTYQIFGFHVLETARTAAASPLVR
ncbi:MAG: hypothetical protein JWQ87_315 [Candidatus Sulfotelmatobacter sp.]|nr:hypothetical protein [Candidatus Sulfotelmatobacter sp.]